MSRGRKIIDLNTLILSLLMVACQWQLGGLAQGELMVVKALLNLVEKCEPEARRPPSLCMGALWLDDEAGHINWEWLSGTRLATPSKLFGGSRLITLTATSMCQLVLPKNLVSPIWLIFILSHLFPANLSIPKASAIDLTGPVTYEGLITIQLNNQCHLIIFCNKNLLFLILGVVKSGSNQAKSNRSFWIITSSLISVWFRVKGGSLVCV